MGLLPLQYTYGTIPPAATVNQILTLVAIRDAIVMFYSTVVSFANVIRIYRFETRTNSVRRYATNNKNNVNEQRV